MSKGTKHIFPKKIYEYKYQQVYEKMLNITNHQGNANQNHNEKLLEENIVQRILFDINHSNIFLAPSPRLMEIKNKLKKWDINLKAIAQQRKP